MKFLVLTVCVAVSTAQGFFGLIQHPNGAVVPVDEPAVAASRADHLSTKYGSPVSSPYSGYPYAAGYGYSGNPYSSGYPVTGYPQAHGYAANYPYAGPLNLNIQLVAHPNGAVVPVDEPAVIAARVDHLKAKGASYAAAAPIIEASPLNSLAVAPLAPAQYSSIPYAYSYPVTGYPQAGGYAATYPYTGPLNLNTQLVAHPNGAVVPVDEPAVIAARVDHLEAKGATYAAAAPIIKTSAINPLIVTPAQQAPSQYSTLPNIASYAVAFPYTGPLNLNNQLISHPNGAVVPVDEPAVVAAKNAHLMAKGVVGGLYGTASPVVLDGGYASSYGLIAHPNGAVVPVDTAAVRAARVEHIKAKALVL